MSLELQDESARIRLRMQSLRRHMHKDARRIVANTTQLLDWKDIAGQFPKTLIAAGLLTGFILGPGRKVVRAVRLSQESIDDLLSRQQPPPDHTTAPKKSLASVAGRMLTGVAVSGVSFLLQRTVESYLTGPTKSFAASTTRPVGSN